MTLRALLGGLPLLLPLAALVCDWRWEFAAAAVCFSAFLVPGLLLARVAFPPTHPLGQLPGRLGTATVMALLVFGVPAVVATKLHWRMPSFLIAYALLYGLVCVLVSVAHVRTRRRPETTPGEWPSLRLPTAYSRWTGLVMLAGAGLTLAGASLGFHTKDHPWWPWTGIGLGGGTLALLVFSVDSLRRRKTLAAEPRTRRDTSSGAARSAAPRYETWIAAFLWLCVAVLAVYLMKAAYEVPRWFYDDVTHGSRAVDMLTGEPMDRYEPSLGQDIPQAPGYILATISLLIASFSWVTNVSCPALTNSVLKPILVLAGVSSLAAALAVALRRHRLLVPLALVAALLVLLKSSDIHRSLVHFLVFRVTQPKSVHLMIIYPIQLASLLLVVTHPSKRHMAAAVAVALAGYLVHPWACVAGAIWSGMLLVYCLVLRRGAFAHALVLVVAATALGGLHQLDAKHDFFGVGESPAQTPVNPVELARDDGAPLPRLDARLTIGTYSLYRLGVLSIPWVLLLGWRSRKCLLIGLLALGAVVLAFAEPVGTLLAKAMTITLLWRLRWLVPSAIGAASLAVCVYWAVTIVLRRSGGGTGWVCSLVGVTVTLAATVGVIWFNPSDFLRRGPPVERLTKFEAISHQVAEALGGFGGEAYVLAPEQRRTRLSMELCQLMPRVKLLVSRRQVIRWFFGEEEQRRRTSLLSWFYSGTMSPAQFAELRQEFPIDCVIVDHGLGRGRAQVRVLARLGWRRGQRFGDFEVWRAPPGAQDGA